MFIKLTILNLPTQYHYSLTTVNGVGREQKLGKKRQ